MLLNYFTLIKYILIIVHFFNFFLILVYLTGLYKKVLYLKDIGLVPFQEEIFFMATKKLMRKLMPKKDSSKSKSKKLTKNIKGSALKFGDIFSFSTKGAAKRNFSSSFEYKNFIIDLKGNVKDGKAKLNIKVEGKSFDFNGAITVSERSLTDLQVLFGHVLSSITNR